MARLPVQALQNLLSMRPTTRKKPTHYPHQLFHGLRTAQLVSSAIVAGIMYFFIYHLHHDHWRTPWTFMVLTAVSTSTIAALAATIVLHCLAGLNPRLNLVLNSCLATLWAVGFALLSWWASDTIGHPCNIQLWHDGGGVMVCRIYKALFTFAMVGFLSTLAALALDVHVLRGAQRLGKYNRMRDLDAKHAAATAQDDPWRTSTDVVAAPGEVLSQQPYRDARGGAAAGGASGYQVPDGQFNYDTGYQGAGGMRKSGDDNKGFVEARLLR